MGTKSLLSLEEFVGLPEDGMRHELDEGELVVMPPATFRHTLITKRIYDSICEHLRTLQMQHAALLGEVFAEAPYLLKGLVGEDTVRQPDVSYNNDDRGKRTDPNGYMEGGPTLAVEVVSPTDAAEELTRKVSQYLAAGSEIVWVVYPASRQVHVFYCSKPELGAREAKILTADQILAEPELFPEWVGIPLRKLFD